MSELLVRDAGPVRTLVLNRPERRNALSASLTTALTDALEAADADASVRVVVLTGAGGAFCSGADLQEMGGGWQGDAFARLSSRLYHLETPVVARIERYALAGSLALVCGAHFAIAEDAAFFATPEIHRGLFPMMVMASLVRTLPRRRVLDMVLLGDRVGAPEAAAHGLISAAVPRERLDAEVAELVDRLVDRPAAAVRLGLRALATLDARPLDDVLPELAAALAEVRQTDDAREGLAAFAEKRPPRWARSRAEPQA